MSLKQIGTEITAKPLEDLEEQEFEKRSEELHRMTDNQLLKEILTKSDKKCNTLIEKQNALIEEFITTVKDLKEGNEANVDTINNIMWLYKSEMNQIVTDEREFKTEISSSIKEAITTTASEVKSYALKQVEETVAETKNELKETQKEIAKQREEMKFQHGFRKFLFWATPLLLLAQTIAIILTTL